MRKLLIGLIAALSIGFMAPAIVANNGYAAVEDEICRGVTATGAPCNPDSTDAQDRVNSLVATIINILSWIVGVVSVIFVIWGGFKYITSGGDSSKVSSAKNTILYAIIGLVIVALAQVIVVFVLGQAT